MVMIVEENARRQIPDYRDMRKSIEGLGLPSLPSGRK
jgi:hypothetical protein